MPSTPSRPFRSLRIFHGRHNLPDFLLIGGLAVSACSGQDGEHLSGSTSGGSATAGAPAGGTQSTSSGATAVGGSFGGSQSGSFNGDQGGSSAGTAVGGSGGETTSVAGSAGTTASGGAGGAAGTAGGGASNGGASNGGAGGAPPTKFCGNITTGGQVRSDFGMYWDQITPENEGKWGSVEGVRNQMNWAGLDRVHDYAKAHNIPMKQHNFVWGSQQPSWLNGLAQADQKAEVEEWIRLYCERYPDTQLIDVVNEPPPHTTPPYTAALGGAGASGYDWIVQAFKWAHQYCPSSILIMNDYNTIETAGDNAHFIDIVNKIKQGGAPIDAIGAQAHGAYNLPTDTVKMYIDKLTSSTGLPVYISEYDINLADDAKQQTVMQSQFTMFWNDQNVRGITIWGYVTGRTWEANTGLIANDGTKRPAMTWLMNFLKK